MPSTQYKKNQTYEIHQRKKKSQSNKDNEIGRISEKMAPGLTTWREANTVTHTSNSKCNFKTINSRIAQQLVVYSCLT